MKNRGFIGIGAAAFFGAVLLIGTALGFFGYQQTHKTAEAPLPASGAVNAVGGIVYYLYGSGVASSDTSVTLTSFKQPVNNYPLSMTDFGTIGYLTLEPGSATRQEFVSFTGVTQNGDGTATLTGVTRGLAPVSPFTASSTLQKAHAGGTSAVLSNPPQFYERFTNKENTQYITGAWGFQGTAPTSTGCATATELCNKAYVDATANAGAATSTETNGGIVELGTLAEQASSFSGGGDKPTVLQTKNSTSTCQVVGTYNIVASSTTGKLDKNCFDQAGNYSLTGNTTLANASTTNLGITGSVLGANGVYYSLPASQGGTSTVLVNDGAGTLSWSGTPRYSLVSNTNFGTVNAFATSTLLNIPAGFMTASSTITVEFTYVCSVATTADSTCSFFVRDATGATFGSISVSCTTAACNNAGFARFTILSNNSLSSQTTIKTGVGIRNAMDAFDNFGATDATASSVNFANAFSIGIVAQGGNANYTPVVHNYNIVVTK